MQLAMILQNFQGQHSDPMMQAQGQDQAQTQAQTQAQAQAQVQRPGSGAAATPPRQQQQSHIQGVATPQRQQSATPQLTTPLGGGSKSVKPASKRSKSKCKSESQSPAPSQHSALVSPTTPYMSVHSSFPGRGGSSTPTPGDTAVISYSASEVAAAQRMSDEFVVQLPQYTYETFIPFLQKFNRENNIPGNFSKPPLFNEQRIDLYRFFCEVIRAGGLEQVHTKRLWRQVAKDAGLPDNQTLPPLLSRWYKVWLQPLEQLRVYPPGHARHTGVGANFSLKKRRRADASPGGTPGPDLAKRSRMASPVPFPPGQFAMPGQAMPGQLTPGQHAMPMQALHHGQALQMQLHSVQPSPGHATPVSAPSLPSQPASAQAHHNVRQVTVPMPPPAPAQARFFPLERTLDTFGGVDVAAAMALRPRARHPAIGDYGSIDVRALALSIESGIPAEVAAALTTLVRVTAHADAVLPLAQCEELAEALLG
ncbi:hypothetical protein LPJ66_011659, partial [Kickxella alabastrina]